MSEKKKKAKVISYYEKSRLGYDIVLFGSKHFGYYPDKRIDISPQKARDLMQDMVIKNLNAGSGSLVLDAGCGEGVVSRYIAKKVGCSIVGITIVPYEFQKAKSLAEKSGLYGLKYYLMDYSKTRFRPNTFDAIYAVESFCHAINTTKTLKEFLRLLKPDGRLVIFDYAIAQDYEFDDHDRGSLDMVVEAAGMYSTKNIRIGKFAGALERAGFRAAKEQDITAHVFPSFRYLRYLSMPAYLLVRLFRMQEHFIDVSIPNELYSPIKKGLIRYCIFTAVKPQTKHL